MNYLITVGLAIITTFASVFGVVNYMPISTLETAPTVHLGSTITTINGSDTLSSSRTVINDNFASLNSTKAEISDVSATTTLLYLATIGTIVTGTWHATPIEVAYNGTGTSSPSTYQVLLGNGANGITVASSTGTSGQFLTSNGAGAYPSWQTGAVDQTADYTWTGAHTFPATSSKKLTLNSNAYVFPATQSANTVLTTDGSGNLSFASTTMLLLATTTTAAMRYATTTIPASTHITYVVSISGFSNATAPDILFNSDAGSNYAFRRKTNDAASSVTNGAGFIALSTIGTTSPSFWKADIWNEATQIKKVEWTGMSLAGTGAIYPTYEVGSGIWNNTSDQITTIVLRSEEVGTLNIGTKIYIYGTPQ